MKLFVCHLFLHPLLLLFCCHCLAAVHGKADADNQHSIDKTNPRFNAIRSDVSANKRSYDHFLTTNSSVVDFPCPGAVAIAPCTCKVDSSNRIIIDCTSVESVDQLVRVFQQEFPVKELYQFTMENNVAITGFPSFMNGITFESVYLTPGPFTLAGISDHFFFDLKDTLKKFVISNSKLATDFFPFFILPFLNQIEYLSIYHSDISRIPPIRAPSLAFFDLTDSPIELLVNGTFPIGPGPMEIRVYGNLIHTIEVGSFFFADQNSADSNEPVTIRLHDNQLQSLKAGTFPLRNGPMIIHLYHNQISSIEPGAFVLPSSTDSLKIFIDLDGNELTTFDEAVFGGMMPFITTLYLYDNPLTCGCDMAWLILNEGFMATINSGATCADGTNLYDLDPQQYIDFC